MAHIHLPDGVFTLPWALLWWSCALFVLSIAFAWVRSGEGRGGRDPRTIALAALLTAALFAIFQVEIPILGGIHLNLTPFVGILAGPVTGVFVLFIVNLLSAAVGHGGWSLIGANLLVNYAELGTAYLCWRLLRRWVRSIAVRGTASAFSGLMLGNAAMIAIIVLSGVQGMEIGLGELVLVFGGNTAGAVFESLFTGFMLAFIRKARPDLLGDGTSGAK